MKELNNKYWDELGKLIDNARTFHRNVNLYFTFL